MGCNDNSTACEKFRTKEDLDEGVFQLMVECMQRGSTDNMSAIAVLFITNRKLGLSVFKTPRCLFSVRLG